jgi:hypothetical protein
MTRYTNKIGSESLTAEQERITRVARKNSKAATKKAEGYRGYSDQLASRLARAVGMDIKDEDEALAHLRKTAKKVLSQLAQGRQPFITFKQVLVGMQKAESFAMKTFSRETSDYQWTLSVRLGHLADEIQDLALKDVIEAQSGEVSDEVLAEYRTLTEHYLMNSVSIGRVLVVNPHSLYKAYTSCQKLSFVTLAHIRKALAVAEKAEHTNVWHDINDKLEVMHKLDIAGSERRGEEPLSMDAFLESLHSEAA